MCADVSWRLIFWINLPFCAMCFAISFVTMKKIHNAQRSMPIDLLGSLLVGGATVCLVLVLCLCMFCVVIYSCVAVRDLGRSIIRYVLFLAIIP